MRNIIKKSVAFMAAGLLSVAIGAGNVYASDNVFDADASGNWYGAGQSVDASSYTGDVIDNELFMAGMDVRADRVDVDGSVFIAGSDVSIVDSKVGGSVFAAGQSVIINSEIKNNIFAVGNNLTLQEDTSVKGLNVAGSSVIVKGEYNAVNVVADTVVFNAKVAGDVNIEAENVTIGDDAEIGGVLKVKSQNEPSISGNASVADYTFEEITKEANENNSGISGLVGGAGKAAAGLVIINKIKKIFKNLFRYALLALVFAFVFKKNLNDSYEYATKRSGAFWGFGALTLIFLPLAAIILCVTIVGLPIAGLVTGIYVLALCFANVFTFGSLVRELIFTHTSKRLNPLLETVLAVLPAAIIKEIPFIGKLVGFACAIYTIGYIVLSITDTISKNRIRKDMENQDTFTATENIEE